MKPMYGDEQPIILAHRGAPHDALENSLTAFMAAVESGFLYLETDVRLGEDGVIYLQHNASTLLPNRLLSIKDRQKPTTLAELLEQFPGHCIAIDPKHQKVVVPLAKLIANAGAANRICIGSSFDARAFAVAALIEQTTGVRPKVARVSAMSVLKLLGNAYVFCKFTLGDADYIHIPHRLVTKRVIRAAHAQDLGIVAWVVNDKTRLKTLLFWGIDGVMTDEPVLAKTAP
ncbi:MAG TPA: glycerophosphodiester phosphodiesterase family protein [Candidatus Saccharimonadales bacterium]|nr:glycerophosphodiester phosphodiesterase family protein [Candidatus Saccharimonadales bacterium]